MPQRSSRAVEPVVQTLLRFGTEQVGSYLNFREGRMVHSFKERTYRLETFR